jgi:hypothetical protein
VSRGDLRRQLWWTPADEAELELVAHELVGAILAHRAACSTCRAGHSCAIVAEAIGHALDWRKGRIVRSKAAWLRELQTTLEAAA